MTDTRIDAIAGRFPELTPVTASCLGEGCDSVALLVNDTWVFRFPKRSDVEAQLAIEAALLPEIAPRLPIEIPRFVFHGRPGDHFPRRFVGYRRIAGAPAIGLDPSELGVQDIARLGHFLASLHGTPLDLARLSGVPEQPLGAVLDELREDAIGDLEQVRKVAPDAPYDQWRELLGATPTVSETAAVLAHNDLAAEHILFDAKTKRVTGVIDWSDVAITAPEADFAGFWHWGGEALATAVLRAYESAGGRLDDGGLEAARYLGACRGAMDVAFGMETERPEYVTAGLRALRLCAGRPISPPSS